MNKINLFLCWTILCFGLFSMKIQAKELPENWFNAAGISSTHEFRKFISELVKDVKCNNKSAIASKLNFPINVTGIKRFKIINEKHFIEKYDLIFNKKVKKAILEQKFENIRRRSDGAMIGSGTLWITELKKKSESTFSIKIYAINN